MNAKLLCWLAVFDAAGFPTFTAWYIWRGQSEATNSWVVFLVWPAASFLVHRDTPKTLGWRADNLWPATRNAAIVFAAFAAALLAIGLALGQPRQIPEHVGTLRHLWTYFAFCLLQEVALNSFLNNRLMSLVSRRWLSSVVAGLIFAGLHWPNPVLVPATLIGGIAMAWLFARNRNVLPLALGQAILGSMIWWAFPPTWHHLLRVGPGFYRPF